MATKPITLLSTNSAQGEKKAYAVCQTNPMYIMFYYKGDHLGVLSS